MSDNNGFTLVEVMIVITVIGIMSVIAMLGSDFLTKHRVRSASRGFYADLQALRQNAMSSGTANTSIGRGLKFTSANSFSTFEFLDLNSNYTYDGVAEENSVSVNTLPGGMTVTLGAAGDPTATPLLFDRRGLGRSDNWSTVGGRTYVFRHPLANPPACVTISLVRIREGTWDGGTCIFQ